MIGKHNIKMNVAGLISSSMVAVVVFLMLKELYYMGFILAFLMALLSFSMFKYLTTENARVRTRAVLRNQEGIRREKYFNTELRVRAHILKSRLSLVSHMRKKLMAFKHRILIIIYVLSIVLVIIVPPTKNDLYISWQNISPINWLRLAASLLLTTFFPGYVTLHILLRFTNKRSEFTLYESCIFSTLLSLFFVPIMAFFSLLCIGHNSIAPILIGFNCILFMIFCIVSRLKCENFEQHETKSVDRNRWNSNMYAFFVLSSVVLSVLLTIFIINQNNFPILAGDQWIHLGQTLHYLEEGFPVAANGVIYPSSPYWFYLYMSSFFALSGFPPINSYIMMFFLTPLPLITFYRMSSAFFKQKNQKICVVATVIFGLFAGFGWIYALYLKTLADASINLYNITSIAGSRTYDLWISSGFFNIVLAPYVIGASSLCMVIFLLRSTSVTDTQRYVLSTILIALGYLTHVVEIVGFIFIFFLISVAKNKYTNINTTLSIVSALILIAALDLLAPAKYYTIFTSEGSIHFSLPFFGSILATLTASLVLFLRKRIKFSKRIYLGNKVGCLFTKNMVKIICIALIVYVFGLCFIIWKEVHPEFSVSLVYDDGLVPWYFYPMRLGIAGAFALAGIIYLTFRKRKRRSLSFFFVLALGSLILARSRYILLIFPTILDFTSLFFEWRIMRDFLWMPISILSAVVIVELFSKFRLTYSSSRIHFKKQLGASILLSSMLIFGVSSSLFKAEHYTLYGIAYPEQLVSIEELEALNYLRLTCPSYATVATLTSESETRLSSFTGLLQGYGSKNVIGGKEPWFTSLVFNSKSPENVLSVLNFWNVKYFYVASRDQMTLHSHYNESFTTSHLIRHLPIIFKNEEVEICELPPFSPPNNSSNFAVVIQDFSHIYETDGLEAFLRFYPIELVAVSQLNYSVYSEIDKGHFKSSTILLVDAENLEIEDYLKWVDKGGFLIVLNTNNHSKFASFLSIQYKNETSVSNYISGENGSISIPNISVKTVSSYDNSTKAIAYYMNGNICISPFAFKRSHGSGQIVYIEIAPYLNFLEKNNYYDQTVFARLSLIFPSLGLVLPKYSDSESNTYFAKLLGEATFDGRVELGTNFFTIFDLDKLHISSVDVSDCIVNGKREDGSIFENCQIYDFNIHGNAKSQIVTSKARVSRGYGAYSFISICDPFSWKLRTTENDLVTFKLLKDNLIHNVTVAGNGSTVWLNVLDTRIENITTISRNPNFVIDGRTSFDSLYVGWPYGIFSAGSEITINGNTCFDIHSSDEGATLLSGLTYSGAAEAANEAVLRWNEMSVPWYKVLGSYLNVMLIGAITSIMLLWIAYNRKHASKNRRCQTVVVS